MYLTKITLLWHASSKKLVVESKLRVGANLPRAAIQVHHFFPRGSSIWELKTSQKTDLETNKKLLPAEKSHGLGTQQESCKKMAVLRRFWVKDPRLSEDKIAKKKKKVYPYRSTRQLDEQTDSWPRYEKKQYTRKQELYTSRRFCGENKNWLLSWVRPS